MGRITANLEAWLRTNTRLTKGARLAGGNESGKGFHFVNVYMFRGVYECTVRMYIPDLDVLLGAMYSDAASFWVSEYTDISVHDSLD